VSAATAVPDLRGATPRDQDVSGLYDGLVVRTVPFASNKTRNVRARYSVPASTHCAAVRHEPPGDVDGTSVNPHERLTSVVHEMPSIEDCSDTEMFIWTSLVDPS
jgi:hypothetical protein